MITAEEAERYAQELVMETIQYNQQKEKIKSIKDALLEYADFMNMNDHVWTCDNGYVELATKVKYKLADIPNETKIDPNVCAIDVAEEAFKAKIVLTKEGKKLLAEEYEPITRLHIPSEKRTLTVQV